MSNSNPGALVDAIGRVIREDRAEKAGARLERAVKAGASRSELQAAVIQAANAVSAISSHHDAASPHVKRLKRLLENLGQTVSDADGEQDALQQKNNDFASTAEKAAYGKHTLNMLKIIRKDETPAMKAMRTNEALEAEKAATARGRAILAERDHIAKKAAQKSSGQSELYRVRSEFMLSPHAHPSVLADRARKAAREEAASKAKK